MHSNKIILLKNELKFSCIKPLFFQCFMLLQSSYRGQQAILFYPKLLITLNLRAHPLGLSVSATIMCTRFCSVLTLTLSLL
jgi:hypothetical protein